MSEHPSNDSLPTPEASAFVDVSAHALASARRRRFLKVGTGVVPVALTLASRPVMATQCLSASAWGSFQGLAVNNSQYTRLQKKSVKLSGTYSLSAWCGVNGSTPSCSGWARIPSCTSSTGIKAYAVSSLCAGVTIPTGLTGSLKVWDVLTKKVGGTYAYSSYQRSMVCAWLNYRSQASGTVSRCVVDSTRGLNQLNLLSAIPSGGTGKGPDGKPWSQDKVITYLQTNWLASA
jgi:hypothetical protein